MNEHLQERFGRSSKDVRHGGATADVWLLPPKLNPRVKQYFEPVHVEGGSWLSRTEIPTSAEVLDQETPTSTKEGTSDSSSGESSDIIELQANRPVGVWDSKEQYLSTQYELYREDALRGLREAVSQMSLTPAAMEEAFSGKIGIYEKVHICAFTLSTRGIATRITFSIRRTGKQILWEQSKRLISGSLVVLTPTTDKFNSKAIVAIVAARPLEGLKANPPELDLFIARAEEQEIDPAVEYIMIEDRGGLWEANRHTLVALQRMMREPFPLSEHLVGAKSAVAAPDYVKKQPKMDLSPIMANDVKEMYENVDVLKRWPKEPKSTLDASQLDALRRILTKRLAIVQGPPGTGKTHVSVQAVKVMLENRKDDDPPILIACQTNHAIDQFLRHIAHFEPDFVRLGGMSKDRDVIKKRTLYEVRKQTSENPPGGCMTGWAKKRMQNMHTELAVLLTPLKPTGKPIDHTVLADFGILTQAQADSLQTGASRWVQDKKTHPNEARSSFMVWLGDKLITVPDKQESEEFGFEFEEADLEFEQLRELEAENGTKDEDENLDKLFGPTLSIADNYTCRKVPGADHKAKEFLKQQDMWKIPEATRGAVYRYLQAEMKKHILVAFREKAKEYNEEAVKRRIGNFERDEPILKRQKIIGMTTTGLSKYRGLLSALQPKIILIEEAAETLEAPVTVACMPSVQHLILVGDHQQLRPHTHVSGHEDEPWFLNVSLFERMVNNGVEFSTLSQQRRMTPEIRRILYPIYGDLITDHPSVADKANRPDVPGMSGVNSYFFTHQWSEQRDDMMSVFNPMETTMIVGFVQYLVYNGVDTEDITVLTFYNGQRKRILKELRSCVPLGGRAFNVVTVDSYQGEENKIVILSLARSNEKSQIGFLGVENRVCVALSRAKCGFYIFGNGMLLHGTEMTYAKIKKKKTIYDGISRSDKKGKKKTWTMVLETFAGQGKYESERPKIEPMRLGAHFTLKCEKHKAEMVIADPDDWMKTIGGCEAKCGGKLPCSHDCPLICHPFPHEVVNCMKCNTTPAPSDDADFTNAVKSSSPKLIKGSDALSSSEAPSSASWNSWAAAEEARKKQEVANYVPFSQRPKQEQQRGGSLEETDVKEVTNKMKKSSFGFDGAGDADGSSGLQSCVRRKFQSKMRVSADEQPEAAETKQEEDLLIDFD